MSVHVMSWVLKHSEETLGRRLVLLVLADHAKEDGTCSWPSVETIATEARLSERQTQYALRGLEEVGAIVQTGVAKTGTRVYSVNLHPGAISAPLNGKRGVQSTAGGVQPIAPEPSLLQPSKSKASFAASPRNPLWDALTQVFGDATTETARSRRGKVCRSLAAAGASPDEIIRRAKSWPRHFDDATLTELALEKHWDTLAHKPLRMARNA